MKRKSYLLAAALLLLAHVPAAAQAAETWQKLAPAGEGFTVLLPTRAAQETQTNPGDPRMKMNIYSSDGADRFFYVSSLNFSGLFQPSAAGFESFVTGFLKSFCGPSRQRGLSCETTFDRELTLSGHRGRQFKVAIGGGGKTFDGVVRIYMTGKHIYALQALGGREGDAAVDRFFNSFTLAAARPAAR